MQHSLKHTVNILRFNTMNFQLEHTSSMFSKLQNTSLQSLWYSTLPTETASELADRLKDELLALRPISSTNLKSC